MTAPNPESLEAMRLEAERARLQNELLQEPTCALRASATNWPKLKKATAAMQPRRTERKASTSPAPKRRRAIQMTPAASRLTQQSAGEGSSRPTQLRAQRRGLSRHLSRALRSRPWRTRPTRRGRATTSKRATKQRRKQRRKRPPHCARSGPPVMASPKADTEEAGTRARGLPPPGTGGPSCQGNPWSKSR